MLSPPPPMPSYLGAVAEGRIQLPHTPRHSPHNPPPGMAYPSPNSIQSGHFLLNRPSSPFLNNIQGTAVSGTMSGTMSGSLSGTSSPQFSSPTHGAYNVQQGQFMMNSTNYGLEQRNPPVGREFPPLFLDKDSPLSPGSPGGSPSSAASFFAR